MNPIDQWSLDQTRRQFFGDNGLRMGGISLAMMAAEGSPQAAGAAGVGAGLNPALQRRTSGFHPPRAANYNNDQWSIASARRTLYVSIFQKRTVRHMGQPVAAAYCEADGRNCADSQCAHQRNQS